jgi:hypothetical protein
VGTAAAAAARAAAARLAASSVGGVASDEVEYADALVEK